jgi:predicted esterase
MVLARRLLAFLVAFTLLAVGPVAQGASPLRNEPELAPLPPEIVYAPLKTTGKLPVTVFLHGMCDTPENECPYFEAAVTRHGWLICPRATVPCTGGGTAFGSTGRAELIESAVQRLRERYPDRVEDGNRTLIGFSLGGWVAADVLQRGDRRYTHALVIAAKAPFDSRRLRDSGVLRLLLAAGDYDASSKTMARTAEQLSRRGVTASFSTFGKVGHRFAVDMDVWLDSALDWLWTSSDAARGAMPTST